MGRSPSPTRKFRRVAKSRTEMRPIKKGRILARLVLAAIEDLGERNGSSVRSICNYLYSEFALPASEVKGQVKKVLERAVSYGEIRNRRGRFLIGDLIAPKRKSSRRSGSERSASKNSFRKRSERSKTVFRR